MCHKNYAVLLRATDRADEAEKLEARAAAIAQRRDDPRMSHVANLAVALVGAMRRVDRSVSDFI